MDRRKFVKRMGLLGGVALADSTLACALGADNPGGKAADCTVVIGNVDYYSYRYSYCKYPERTAEKLRNITASGQYPLLYDGCFDRVSVQGSVLRFRVSAASAVDGKALAGQMLEALQTHFPDTFAAAQLVTDN